jgi:hypothetical protein
MLRRIGGFEIVDGLQIVRLVAAACIISDLTPLALNPKKSTHIVKKAMSAIRLVFEQCLIISYKGDRRESGPGQVLRAIGTSLRLPYFKEILLLAV